MSIEDLKRQWPRPRIGERVKLWNTEHLGEVVSVRGASAVLSTMREIQAMRFGPDVQATYGPHWKEIYYQADVIIHNQLRTVEPREVEKILPPD
jgi:hypothetical protein